MTKAIPPVAKRVPHSHTHHNVTREDPYAWLRAENWQEVMQKPDTLDAEIRAYLDAENAFYEAEFGQPGRVPAHLQRIDANLFRWACFEPVEESTRVEQKAAPP